MTVYYRPIAQVDPHLSAQALKLVDGWCWFDRAERIERGVPSRLVDLSEIPAEVIDALTAPRAPAAGVGFDGPSIMGILNLTPDSFSDGGKFNDPDIALHRARDMIAQGADILDLGGESTRPGADPVAQKDEIARTAPVIAALSGQVEVPISIDTRNAPVAEAALAAGATMVNDVAAFTHDPALAEVTARFEAPVCLMHSIGTPKTMQQDPRYANVLLDVYDFLEERISVAEAAGIPRHKIIVDPGIGFGKTQAHNLELLRGISLFHGLGCAILLGVSRKRFIGDISGAVAAEDRALGSVSVALGAVAQGVQMLRVHDIAETKQALSLQEAVLGIKKGQS